MNAFESVSDSTSMEPYAIVRDNTLLLSSDTVDNIVFQNVHSTFEDKLPQRKFHKNVTHYFNELFKVGEDESAEFELASCSQQSKSPVLISAPPENNMTFEDVSNNDEPDGNKIRATRPGDEKNGPHLDTKTVSKGSIERKLLEKGISLVYNPQCHQRMNRFKRMLPDVSDMRVFLIHPGPESKGYIQCHIERVGSRYSMKTRFNLYLTEGNYFLVSARKQKASTNSNHIISLDKEVIPNSTGNHFANLRSNFLGTKFWLLDKGECSKAEKENFFCARTMELGAVMYDPNVLGIRGPRKITALIPSVNIGKKPSEFKTKNGNSSGILYKYKRGCDHEKLVIMENKLPEWNAKMNTYYLDFKGRPIQPSIKNFQLITTADSGYIVLQFGKVCKNVYAMDYQYPMSALQAFAICLSSLDYKIACD